MRSRMTAKKELLAILKALKRPAYSPYKKNATAARLTQSRAMNEDIGDLIRGVTI